MKVIRYIIGVLLFAIACSCAEIELQPEPAVPPGLIQVIPRVIPFSDSAATRADDDQLKGKETAETNLTCMALVIFANDGKCIDFQFKEGSDMSFIIDRKVLSKKDDENQSNDIAVDNASIYAFANIPGLKGKSDWEGKDLSHFENLSIEVKGVAIPSSGLPMSGAFYGKTDADSKPLPYVDLDPDKVIASPLMTIDLYSAYAKVVVTVSVDAKEYESLGIISSFTPTNWQVFNIPAKVDFNSETNSDTDVLEAAPSSARFEGVQAIENDNISFSFYLPERYLTGRNTEYKYPFAESDGSVRDEDLGLRQKYKKEHLTSTQKATYVKFSGTFSDYQGHKKRVEYDLYVGGNEYDDFNIKRNVLYTNDVVVRGAKQSNGDNDGDGVIDDVDFMNTVSYDGRVNVDESAFIVRLERETVLDAHWEIRPMRISVLEGSVTVRIEDADSTPWIRMENSTAVESADDKTKYLSGATVGDVRYGKRKYFTTDLLTELSGNVEDELGPGEHCIWVYVDENSTQASGNNTSRSARLSLTYTDANGIVDPDVTYYTINQFHLHPVTTTRSTTDVDGTSTAAGSYTYYIESYEEYLYDYDALSSYGQTEWNGMEWGLNGVQLSHIRKAVSLKATSSGLEYILSIFGWNKQEIIDNAIAKIDPQPYYDFYMVRDVADDVDVTPNAYVGYQYNTEITSYLRSQYSTHQIENSNDTHVAKIDKVTLDEDPKSAIAYCYNKNKRNANGEVDEIKWYLPAVDEIEDIAEAAYQDFDGVFQKNMYWSCQPSYLMYQTEWSITTAVAEQSMSGPYFIDNPSRARATRALWGPDGFEGVPPSGDGKIADRTGSINKPAFRDPTISLSDPVYNQSYDPNCGAYPGNMARTGSKARVRCVYKP